MSDSDVEQVHSDAEHSGQELQIRRINGIVTYNTIEGKKKINSTDTI